MNAFEALRDGLALFLMIMFLLFIFGPVEALVMWAKEAGGK
jgi:hypothetical protein